MLKSMTGFGRNEETQNERKIVVEMKSVNHRYSDISIKMPKKISFFETNIRSLLKEYIRRGKLDIFITYEDYTETNLCVKYNEGIAKQYYEYLHRMSETFQLNNDVTVSMLSRYPEVLVLEEQVTDEEKLWNLVEKSIRFAAKKLVESRISEGENLKADINCKLVSMLNIVEQIEERTPQLVLEYRQKIMNKVKDLLGDTHVDEVILATEITVFADKICTDEEIVRLRSHIETMQKTLDEKEEIGRKLDFIAQEMNREANTILSKANDLIISNLAIDLKTEIEKVREQIQNIE